MSTLSLSRPARVQSDPRLRGRRPCRFPLACEYLELRQLLSVYQGSSTANAALGHVVAQPNLPAVPLFGSAAPTGLSPNQVTTAYGVNQINFGGVVGNGAGQTIAIIDAELDPNISSDLARFDSQFGLAAPPSFSQYVQNGLYGNNPGWALETALDVEWAHAVAPAANIMLVESQPYLSDLFSAVTFASQQPGVSVVSMSWGTNEFAGENAYDSTFTTPSGHAGVTFVASSGDSSTTSYPASSPNVLAVGGTTLNVTSNGQYLSETAWSGSGGGSSPYEAKPAWQTNGLTGSGRATPDIAFNADPATGVSVFDSVRYGGQSGWFTVGGTSVGAPSWAGLIAITDQGLAINGAGSLASAQSSLYQLPSSDFNAITSGSNAYNTAGPGYNLVTGLGTPKANLLVPGLVTLNSASQKAPLLPPVQHGPNVTAPGGHLLLVTSGSTNSGTETGAGTGSSSNQGTGTSITALNPNSTSTTNTTTVTVIYIVPPPLLPLVVHLTASAAPVTAQSNSSVLSTQEEQPTSLTQFGQGPDYVNPIEFIKPTEVKSQPASFLDYVEPIQPDPALAPMGDPGLPPSAFKFRSMSGFSDEVDFAVSARLIDSWYDRSTGAEKPQGESSGSWGASTLFGAAVVAFGGYQLAIRDPDRIQRRPFSRNICSTNRLRHS